MWLKDHFYDSSQTNVVQHKKNVWFLDFFKMPFFWIVYKYIEYKFFPKFLKIFKIL